jgi:putative motility protein YjfB-like
LDIARLSMGLNSAKVAQKAQISVLKMAMDSAKDQGAAMNKLLESSNANIQRAVSPNIGGNIDIMA